jgi:DeoR/GlpR family transcriptional regulator of sugar metabolism
LVCAGITRLPSMVLGDDCYQSRSQPRVADSSKFGRIGLYQILEPQGIAKLVTDAGIPGEAREALTRGGVEAISA